MSRIHVLMVTTSPVLKAEVIAERVTTRIDMLLVHERCVSVSEVDALLAEMPFVGAVCGGARGPAVRN